MKTRIFAGNWGSGLRFFGQTDSACFIATEYIDGVTLREHLSGRRLKLIDVLDVVIQVVAALNAAHEAGVTHRDLKPENVMVRKDKIVKVLDFGLAKPSEPAAGAGGSAGAETNEDAATKVLVRTEPGLVMGTVSYMSPEQSAGKVVDQRTDIWSAGVVLYEMLSGALPFPGKDIHRQIIAIQEAEPAPWRSTSKACRSGWKRSSPSAWRRTRMSGTRSAGGDDGSDGAAWR